MDEELTSALNRVNERLETIYSLLLNDRPKSGHSVVPKTECPPHDYIDTSPNQGSVVIYCRRCGDSRDL
jgi:hypothetical protein